MHTLFPRRLTSWTVCEVQDTFNRQTYLCLVLIIATKIMCSQNSTNKTGYRNIYFAVSPYLKTLSMVSSAKLLHLLEAFSTPWFLYAQPSNHHLVFFILEVFNNIIQYQFDGKCFILSLFVILHYSVVCNAWIGRERVSSIVATDFFV